MTAPCFVDTNVFIYAGSKDPADVEKRKIARSLLALGPFGLSAQVLQEFVATAAAKKRLQISDEEAEATVRDLSQFVVAPITASLVATALQIRKQYRISYWDSAIIAAAEELQADVVYSEDSNAGQKYRGIMVVNPFASIIEET